MATIAFDQFHNIINNEKCSATETFKGVDPSNGKPLWDVPAATEADLNEAVKAAKVAFKSWSTQDHSTRSQLLCKYADALDAHVEELTKLLQRETGKPKDFAKSEINLGIATFRKHAKWSIEPEVQKDDDEVKIVIEHAPIGVVAGIVPWNFPFHLSVIKIAPALMVGCTMILKPSPFTPYTALKMGEIAATVLPPGVLQVLAGTDSFAPYITKHPDIGKVSFTGSIATGKKVLAASADTLKRVNLELGGNDAAIVTEDFDVQEAARMVAMTSFAHSGQICIATKRVYVHDSIFDEFMGHFKAIVSSFTPREGFCSPIQNKMQYEKVKSIYLDCKTNNYEFAVGSSDSWNDSEDGYYIKPAVIVNPPDTSRIVEEEPFGPIVPVMRWKDEEDVIARANDTVTGLGGTVFCRDQKRAWSLASSLETGNVWVNSGLKMDPIALFCAHKQSGIGSALGPLGLKSFTNQRVITYWKSTNGSASGSNIFSQPVKVADE